MNKRGMRGGKGEGGVEKKRNEREPAKKTQKDSEKK